MSRKRNRQLKIITVSLILFLVLIGIILFQSSSPMRKAKGQAIKISEEVANITEVKDFYWFTRDKTYFTVVGLNDKNEAKIVLLPQDGSEALVMNEKDGINADDAIQVVLDTKETKKIKKVSLGMYDKKPVWEVVATAKDNSLTYYLVDFKEGKITNKMTDL
ncbi:cell wall elongation regulator TseB-like domain-containing protein [Vagococcus hydrophili]|uniref:DUF5590 domain-containing protein n=1 Tax=Vagococcus hydrophili TaxID=2714947 RepID=A0A6G8AQR6_9ENTE|nr:DUF5590 domain-containing protein [Vagococcus hydrophili]QIL47282.1 DUF5590 domain-containing protein [Vagococcus hydrophili]